MKRPEVTVVSSDDISEIGTIKAISAFAAKVFKDPSIEELIGNPNKREFVAGIFLGNSKLPLQRPQCKAMGNMILWPDNTASIMNIVTEPELQHNGYGSAILSALEQVAVIRNFEQMHILAFTEVVDFYQANGYHISGEVDGDVVTVLKTFEQHVAPHPEIQ